MSDTQTTDHNTQQPQYPECPGISPELVQRSKLIWISEEEAEHEFGYAWECYRIPFLDLDGNPIMVQNKPYNRYRLKTPRGSMKYFQPKESSVHNYLPVGLKALLGPDYLIIIEGERKAMALVEAGYAAISMGGFYGFATKGGTTLSPELKSILEQYKPKVIYFLGDSDTGHNYQFSDAAIKFVKLVGNCQVKLPRIPWNSQGKGADDIRELLGDEFNEYFDQLLKTAVPLDRNMNKAELAVTLVRAEIGAAANLDPNQKRKVQHRMMEMIGALEKFPIEQDQLIKAVCGAFDLSAVVVKKCAKIARQEFLAELNSKQHRGPAFSPKPGDEPKAIAQPRDEIIYLPSEGFTSFAATNSTLFRLLGQTGKYYMRGSVLCEVVKDEAKTKLENVTPNGLRTRIEKLGAQILRMKMKEGVARAVQSNLKEEEAKALLEAPEKSTLPRIRGLSSCPVMAYHGEKGCRILGAGYDRATGIYVTSDAKLPPVPTLEEAKNRLLNLLGDFEFQNASDKSRAIALLLTPAFVLGQFSQSLTPLFMVEANDSQTGKGYLLDLVAAIYNQFVSMVPQHSCRGVGSSEESFHQALSAGYPFVVFDNWRGTVNMPTLESFLTDRQPENNIRLPHVGYVSIKREHYVMAMTSNGVQFSKPDLANRSLFIRLRKKPENYNFQTFAEGELLNHVRANWLDYLAAVYAIISEWSVRGCQRMGVRYDSFTDWAQVMDWIVRNIFSLPPLLAGLKEEKQRISSPALTFVREIGLAIEKEGRLNHVLSAKDLAELAETHAIRIPSSYKPGDVSAAAKSVGIALGPLFRGRGEVQVAGFKVIREDKMIPRTDGSGGAFPMKSYTFTSDQPTADGAESAK